MGLLVERLGARPVLRLLRLLRLVEELIGGSAFIRRQRQKMLAAELGQGLPVAHEHLVPARALEPHVGEGAARRSRPAGADGADEAEPIEPIGDQTLVLLGRDQIAEAERLLAKLERIEEAQALERICIEA